MPFLRQAYYTQLRSTRNTYLFFKRHTSLLISDKAQPRYPRREQNSVLYDMYVFTAQTRRKNVRKTRKNKKNNKKCRQSMTVRVSYN